MPKRSFESTESHTQLPLAKEAKTEYKQSQTELIHLPHEILAKIFGYLSPPEIAQGCRILGLLNQVITTQYHGPCSHGFNRYLDLFPGNKENTALTYYDYCEKVKRYKEPFLEKQFLEIQTIQKNLTDCDYWSNVSPKLKEEILQIEEKDINYTEANRREALLDAIHVEIIKSNINLQSQSLDLTSLNLTRLPKALFTDNELQAFWQALRGLSLHNNQLTTLPAEIGGLQRLRRLSLYNNQLISLPVEIGILQALKWLSLSNNQLTTVPVEIGRLQALEALSLHNNQLTSTTLEQFEQRFGTNFVQNVLKAQSYPNIVQAEDLSNRNSPLP